MIKGEKLKRKYNTIQPKKHVRGDDHETFY